MLLHTDPNNTAFVVYGASGCGKSSLVARAADVGRTIFGAHANIIVRFVGLTPQSSNVRDLMAGLHHQLSTVLGAEEDQPSDVKDLIECTHALLARACKQTPIVLLLDGLENLSPSNNGRDISTWLPAK